MGFDIIHEDRDFFSYTPEYDLIIDNIPFSKKKEVLMRLKKLDKPFMIIAPSVLLCYKYFQTDFKDHLQIIIPYNRVKFQHLTKQGKNYTPPYATFFFCYKMKLPKDLIFIN